MQQQRRRIPVTVECIDRTARQLQYRVMAYGRVIQVVRRQKSSIGDYPVYVSDRLRAGDGYPVEYLGLDEAKAHTRLWVEQLITRMQAQGMRPA